MKKKVDLNIDDVMEFLRESNAIEDVRDEDSLKQALKAWEFLITCPELNIPTILMVHGMLMKNQNLYPNEKGYFRTVPVWVGGREGANSIKIPDLMESWLLDVETSIKIPGEDGKHIKLDHIEYERIHPFVDGNGRTGRMFLNWERVQAGLPLLIIHEGPEQMEYYKWFK